MNDDRVTVREINPVWSATDRPELIKDGLSYRAETWIQGRYRKHQKFYQKYLVDRKGIFLTGFIPRVHKLLADRNIPFRLERPDYPVDDSGGVDGVSLYGKELRDYQLDALHGMLARGRGVCKAPTGSGKTVTMAGLIGAYPGCAVLVVVHTASLFNQTIEELGEMLGEHIGGIGDGLEDVQPVTVGMVQTLARRPALLRDWGLVVVDECHHVTSIDGQYGGVLQQVMAPYRFGFSATPPEDRTGKALAMEGLLGPVVAETSYEELQEDRVLAEPIIKIYESPEFNNKDALRKGKYAELYERGIVKFGARNSMIMDRMEEFMDSGLTVLVMVERVKHGLRLADMAESRMSGKFVFLSGDTPADVLEDERESFRAGQRRGVIATRVWSEGVDIPNVGAVINAVGGESEIAAIQRFGRGLRRPEGKDRVYLVDFFDTHHRWFLKHSGKRICHYIRWGWL